MYAEIETTAADDAIITSSTSGIMPSELQAEMSHPERLDGRTFNPVYLLPLVELVRGTQTDNKYIEWGKTFLRTSVCIRHCRVEIAGFLSDRLQEALWREALWLLHDKVATADEIDALLHMALDCAGRRWARCRHSTWRAAKEACGRCWPCLARVLSGLTKRWMPELSDDFVNMWGTNVKSRPQS